MTSLDLFLQACSSEITRRAAEPGPIQAILQEGADAFEVALGQATVLDREPTAVPVTAALARAEQSALVSLARDAHEEIPWIPSHRMTDGGTEAALASLHEVRDLGDLICGLLLMDAGCSYPEHSHPPQEIYLPITGGGRWRYGGSAEFREIDTTGLLYNHPNDVHAIIAGDSPLLALYLLWP